MVVLAPADNVGIAGRNLVPGEWVPFAAGELCVITSVPLGHKIALRDIAAGAKIFRCAVPIGSATCPVRAGEHVHTHNLKSDYLPTFTLDAPLEPSEDAR